MYDLWDLCLTRASAELQNVFVWVWAPPTLKRSYPAQLHLNMFTFTNEQRCQKPVVTRSQVSMCLCQGTQSENRRGDQHPPIHLDVCPLWHYAILNDRRLLSWPNGISCSLIALRLCNVLSLRSCTMQETWETLGLWVTRRRKKKLAGILRNSSRRFSWTPPRCLCLWNGKSISYLRFAHPVLASGSLAHEGTRDLHLEMFWLDALCSCWTQSRHVQNTNLSSNHNCYGEVTSTWAENDVPLSALTCSSLIG